MPRAVQGKRWDVILVLSHLHHRGRRYELSGHVTSAGSGHYTGTVHGGESKDNGRLQLSQSGKSLSVTASGGGGSARLTFMETLG
jgi:hypothetical protein